MKKLMLCLALLMTGCRGLANNYTVGAALSFEQERPDGKAVAKVEVRYTPPPPAKLAEPTFAQPADQNDGFPQVAHAVPAHSPDAEKTMDQSAAMLAVMPQAAKVPNLKSTAAGCLVPVLTRALAD